MTNNLQKKLAVVNHAVSTKSQLPILLNILFEVTKESIKIVDFINLYRWLILLAVPFVVFLIFLFFLLFSPPATRQEQVLPSPTPMPQPTLFQQQQIIENYQENEWEQSRELLPGFQGKEILSNGNVVYIYTSSNPLRPNITITSKNNEPVFSREVSDPSFPLATIPLFIDSYGNPDKIISGTKFYGSKASIYIYGSMGAAFISNPQTEETYEKHLFPLMSADEYLLIYGDLN